MLASPLDVLSEAADGDVAAFAEMLLLCVSGMAAVTTARQLVIDENEKESTDSLRGKQVVPPSDKVALSVDLGNDGEPRGVSRVLFKPILLRSDFLKLEASVPLGLLVEERDGGIIVTGALPGYGAFQHVQEGDWVRAVTAYVQVVAGAPMWQQVTSGTPIGKRQLKRVIFRTDNATWADVRSAIASHQEDSGGNGMVTLVVERFVNESTPLAPRDGSAMGLEPLQDVLMRDVKLPVALGGEENERSLIKRAGRLLGRNEPDDM
eukprot:CAMPEP_0119313470 /NCGR_PEP_ID=MMETSP1333-20130426/29195_1 /TAXON_ID=418940 /ORGANISM="Scyphosphaera apsteinii, Strain RCC1455" /LENGTH=263 /DNA_ID=CAMNT_0007318313 /DNA_START=240 /DNA_END=1031 /DNA_ORIENTATION=-